MSERRVERFKDLENRIISCKRCPRLVEFREKIAKSKRKGFMDWNYWGRPVPGFGSAKAKLLILGLAPAAHGGNRTGRVFTGDSSAQFLFKHLHEAGLANHSYSLSREDGLELSETYVTAAVKCVPPENRPTSRERVNCSEYLAKELRLQKSLRVVLVLGGFAFDAYRRLLAESFRLETAGLKFRHGAVYRFGRGFPSLYASYHPSPHNTNTGKLTPTMFREILEKIKTDLNSR
jgi:uracil-DNA glycosylase